VSPSGAAFFAAIDGADEALPVPSVGDLLQGWHLPSPGLVTRTIRRPWKARPAAIASTLLPSGRYDLRERTRVLDGLRPGWPPGLLICATRRDDGRRVVFGRPGAPYALVSEAVAASCAIPSYFASVPIGGHHHVDGGVHSPTNADVLANAGLDVVIVVSPMSAAHGSSRGADAGMRWAMHRRLEREIRRLRAGGTEVVRFEPSPGTLQVMGLNAMAEDRSGAVAEAARHDALAHATSKRSAPRLAALIAPGSRAA
jgi:NTE family protein